MSIKYRSSALQELSYRGFIYQTIENENVSLDDLLHQEEVTIYLGIDPTSHSLHVGNLSGLMMMKWMQKQGHKVILIIGGATARIGDPSGRNKEREVLDANIISSNISYIRSFLEKFFFTDDTSSLPVEILDNYTWLNNVKYLDILNEFGKLISVNYMLSAEMIKNRIDNEIHLSFLEFNYSLLQAYDFLHLYRNKGCKVQVGGSDQWFNITMGIDMVHKITNESLYAITWPLVLDNQGNKLGKSAGNAIFIDPKFTSAYDYWQYWRNVDDNDVIKFLKIFTFLNRDEIERISTLNINDAKKFLQMKLLLLFLEKNH